MKRWQDFLDSLSTTGGGIAILSLLSFIFMIVLTRIMRHGSSGEIVTIVSSAFTGAFSALLVALKGNSSKQQMQDRVDTTVAPAAKVDVAGASNVTVATSSVASPAPPLE